MCCLVVCLVVGCLVVGCLVVWLFGCLCVDCLFCFVIFLLAYTTATCHVLFMCRVMSVCVVRVTRFFGRLYFHPTLCIFVCFSQRNRLRSLYHLSVSLLCSRLSCDFHFISCDVFHISRSLARLSSPLSAFITCTKSPPSLSRALVVN